MHSKFGIWKVPLFFCKIVNKKKKINLHISVAKIDPAQNPNGGGGAPGQSGQQQNRGQGVLGELELPLEQMMMFGELKIALNNIRITFLSG